jgi:hypothetical protein
MGTEEVGHIIEEPFGAIGKKRKRVKDSTVNPLSSTLNPNLLLIGSASCSRPNTEFLIV